MDAQTKPHLSASQLDLFCRCPEAWRRRYVENEIIPPGIAMLKGSAVHAGAEVNFRQKIETRTDLKPKDIIDASVASIEAAKAGGITLDENESSAGLGAVFHQAVADVCEMATVHATEQAPDYQPTLVEQPIRIELPKSPRDLLAVIDLADDCGRVVDLKTAGKAKSQDDADASVQLTVYAAAYQALEGRPAESVRLDTIVQTKTKTYRHVAESTRGPADFSALANRIETVTTTIERGLFPPAPPGAWWCSAKFCGYFRTCPYVNSERLEKSRKGA